MLMPRASASTSLTFVISVTQVCPTIRHVPFALLIHPIVDHKTFRCPDKKPKAQRKQYFDADEDDDSQPDSRGGNGEGSSGKN